MRKIIAVSFFVGSMFSMTPASASLVNFQEIPPANGNTGFLTEEYAPLGIHFHTTDDGSILDGISAGDPGNWYLEGTNGPAFLGFNGASYSLTTTFNAPVSMFRLDVSRSNGSGIGDTFTLKGLLNGVTVDTVTVPLLSINTWTTVHLNGLINETRWSGAGQTFHPYGVDNVNWAPEPASVAFLGVACLGLVRKATIRPGLH